MELEEGQKSEEGRGNIAPWNVYQYHQTDGGIWLALRIKTCNDFWCHSL